jgi:hypothetical protein
MLLILISDKLKNPVIFQKIEKNNLNEKQNVKLKLIGSFQ